MNNRSTALSRRRLAGVFTAAALALASGCENAGQGAASGAAVGALSGLAIGSFSGNAGEGAAIGAIAGGLGGAVIGDQNRREREKADAQARAASSRASSTPAPPPVQFHAAPLLDRLIGRWSINGWTTNGDGERIVVAGSADGVADKNFFLRLDIRVTDPRTGERVEGTSVISQEGGHNLTMSNSFSSSPVMSLYSGEADRSGQIMTFVQTVGRNTSMNRRLVVRFTGADRWTAEGWERRDGDNVMTESLTFIRSR